MWGKRERERERESDREREREKKKKKKKSHGDAFRGTKTEHIVLFCINTSVLCPGTPVPTDRCGAYGPMYPRTNASSNLT